MNDSLIERMKRYADDATACTPEVARVLREAALRIQGNIDRNIYKKKWGLCDVCQKGYYGLSANYFVYNEQRNTSTIYNVEVRYCPRCGRPLTEEAWKELEKRLEG